MLDDLGLLLIKPRKLRACVLINAKQLIQLGMHRKRVAPVRTLNEKRHDPGREHRDGTPVERFAVQHQPQQRLEQDNPKGRRVRQSLTDVGGPMLFNADVKVRPDAVDDRALDPAH
jgi:hypothetical protein